MFAIDWSIVISVVIGIWVAISIFSIPGIVMGFKKTRGTFSAPIVFIGAVAFFVAAPFVLIYEQIENW